jgi:hypothetical protein
MYRAAIAGALPAARTPIYLTDMRDSYESSVAEEDTSTVDLDYVLHVGVVHAAVITFTWDFQAAAQSFVYDWICSGNVEYTRFGRAYDEDAPYLGDTALAAGLAQLYIVERDVRAFLTVCCMQSLINVMLDVDQAPHDMLRMLRRAVATDAATYRHATRRIGIAWTPASSVASSVLRSSRRAT